MRRRFAASSIARNVEAREHGEGLAHGGRDLDARGLRRGEGGGDEGVARGRVRVALGRELGHGDLRVVRRVERRGDDVVDEVAPEALQSLSRGYCAP